MSKRPWAANGNMQSADALAYDAVGDLMRILRAGAASANVQLLIADYLETLSPTACRQLLGERKPRKGVTTEHRRALAVEAFELAEAGGALIDAAEHAAYDTYFRWAVPPQTFAEDATRRVDQFDEYPNRAEETMAKVIRPILRAAGVLRAKRPGPKSSSTKV